MSPFQKHLQNVLLWKLSEIRHHMAASNHPIPPKLMLHYPFCFHTLVCKVTERRASSFGRHDTVVMNTCFQSERIAYSIHVLFEIGDGEIFMRTECKWHMSAIVHTVFEFRAVPVAVDRQS
jgi:hypothetical protein